MGYPDPGFGGDASGAMVAAIYDGAGMALVAIGLLWALVDLGCRAGQFEGQDPRSPPEQPVSGCLVGPVLIFLGLIVHELLER